MTRRRDDRAGAGRAPALLRALRSLRTRGAARTCAFALLFVALALAGNFARSAHWLLVPHHLCEAHQTVEHGPSADVAAEAAPHGTLYLGEDRPHEQCPLGDWTRTEQALDTRAALACGEFEPRPVEVRVPPEAQRAIPLLLLAPKHSPPA